MIFPNEKSIAGKDIELERSGAHEIAELKATLFEVLETGTQQGPEITATQQLGIQMTNAARRDGVTIIQNQNVQVMSRIMPLMVKALKYCDSIEHNYMRLLRSRIKSDPEVIDVSPDQLDCMINDKPVEEDDPIEKCCQHFFERGVQWEDFQDQMKQRYLAYVYRQYRTKKETAQRLKIGETYMIKLSKQRNIKN
jgi:hypothetical protein